MSDVIEIEAEVNESVGGTGGVAGYHYLPDKPSINGVTLVDNKSAASLGLVDDVQQDGESVVDGSVANLTPFSGGSTSSAVNKAGLVPKPPTIEETGQWHILTDNGWKEATPQPDSSIPWATKYSPTFSGIPKAPTAAVGTNTTQIATTAFVHDEILEVPKVYCGEEAPEDPNAMVWVDTNGDPYPMEEEIAEAVDEWVTAHPEAVTTVQDGAVSKPKLDSNLKSKIDLVDTNATHIANLDALVNNLATLQEGSTTGDAELIAARTVGSTTYQNLHTAIDTEFTNVKSEITQLQSLAPAQWIDNSKVTSGRYWKHGIIDYSSGTPGACTLNYLIPIIGGVKYCYTDLYAYFCNVKYSNGTVVALSNTTGSKESGEFTALYDGVLYVTMYYANGEAAPNATFYNTEEYPTEKVVGIFDPRANGLDVSKLVTKGGFGQVDEKNTTFFTHGDNLFDKSDVTEDVRITSDGTDVEASSGFATSGYIDLYGISSIKFMANSGSVLTGASGYYALYDSSKNVVTARTIYEGTGTISTSSAAYMRVSYSKAQTASFMVVDGSKSYSAYVPFGWKFLYNATDADHAETADKIEVITVSPSDDIIQTLKDNAGKHIFFADGEYDIVAIYKAKYGNSYFDNYAGYSTSDVADRGLPILRDTHIECSKGAKFIGTYSGGNTSVRQNFSAFALESGVVLDGLNVDITGLRNVVHDDFDNNYSAKTILRNCSFKADNNNIAGGLGFHDIVIIENCKFKNTNAGHTYDISYHNNGNANAQSELVIKDNYFYKGISLRWYGSSTLLTDALVSNNSMANTIEKRAENSSALIDNIDLTEWNNVIRN